MSWTKEKMREVLFNLADKQGISLTVDTIEGEPPLKWTFRGVRITGPDQTTADISLIRMRIAILPLLRGEIGISYLEIDDAQVSFAASHSSNFSLSFPWSISVKSLKADSLHILNRTTGQKADFSIRGKGYVRRQGKSFYVEANIASTDLIAQGSLSGSKRSKHIVGALRADLKSKEAFSPFFTLPVGGDASIDLHAQGPWKFQNQASPFVGQLKIDVHHLDIPNLDTPSVVEANFALYADQHIDISSISLQSDLFSFKGSAHLAAGLSPREARVSFLFPNLSRLNSHFSGMLSGEAAVNENKVEISLASDKISYENITYTGIAGKALGHKIDKTYSGNIELHAEQPHIPLAAISQFSWQTRHQIAFIDLSLIAPATKIVGDILYDFQERKTSGGLTLQAQDLSHFALLLPGSKLKGSCGAKLDFQGEDTVFNFRGRNIQCFDLLSKEWQAEGTVSDLWTNPKGNISVIGQTFYLKSFFFDYFTLETKEEDGRFPFTISAGGDWKSPFNLKIKGSFAHTPGFFDLQLDHLSGQVLQKPLSLEKPFSVQKSEAGLLITETKLYFAEGYLQGAIDLSPTSSKVHIKAEHFPIDLFALATTRFTLSGTCALDIAMEGQGENRQGRANLLLERGAILQSGKQTPILSKGTLQANLQNQLMQVHGSFLATGDQFCEIALSLPLKDSNVDRGKPFSGEITAEGHLEEIFDFINIGSHRTTGNVSLHLIAAQTLNNPSLHGTFELKEGSYENYFTGILLRDINASGHAEHSHLFIKELTAKDETEGTFTATGQMAVVPEFRFELNGHLKDLKILDIPWLSTRGSGDATLTGTTKEATVKGSLTLSRADLQIPDRLPSDLPSLPIQFKNPPEHIKNAVLSLEPSYPFYYDVDTSATGSIFLTGRGLEAELAGNLHLTGRNLAIEPRGTLHLVKGKFHFGGKEFILTQGDVSFAENASHLNITATLNLSDITVYALLRGPLQSPILTFQSTPTLPTSSVLARILFNKDISELTAAQLLQLADAIVSLSGGAAPSVLDSIRQSIGVDRLNIVTDESDTIAVQVGKYLAEGVMVTLSQSAESSQVIVEVELKGGFILQAETQEDDQGKFSLKWNMNY
ncbi:MAG: translocation/assembly module TamB domain-containing protein [Verrucomicrobia bacterium]|nr:translocation/assembly module TamB domain-containing protein [Verrucomicrobiota bacterium]